MKAYITHKGKGRDGLYYAEVVTEQDYHEGGPFAHSYKGSGPNPDDAQRACEYWCRRNACVIVSVNEVAE